MPGTTLKPSKGDEEQGGVNIMERDTSFNRSGDQLIHANATAHTGAANGPASPVRKDRLAVPTGGNGVAAARATNNTDRFKMGKTNAARAKQAEDLKVAKLKKKVRPENVFVGNLTPQRKQWLFAVAVLTCWVPNWALSLARIRGQDVQQAWREKFALCLLVVIASVLCVGWLEVSSSLLCPKLALTYTTDEVKLATNKKWVMAHGKVLDITRSTTSLGKVLEKYIGQDVSTISPTFALLGHPSAQSSSYTDLDIAACISDPQVADSWLFQRVSGDWDGLLNITASGRLEGCAAPGRAGATEQCYISSTARSDMKNMIIGDIVLDKTMLSKNVSEIYKPTYIIVKNKVYDVTQYLRFAIILGQDEVVNESWETVNAIVRSRDAFLPHDLTIMLLKYTGRDASVEFNNRQQTWSKYLKCMEKLFYVGEVTPDVYKQICSFGNPLLMVISGCVYSIVVIKFGVSLLFSFKSLSPPMNAYCICFVPCYTEGFTMRVTLETLANCTYDDRKKLLFVVCDGNLTGKGNPKPTPRIALDILGWRGTEPDPQYYIALGKGADKINMGKIYSGIYEFNSHKVPFIVVAKVGKADEAKKPKPGNRGKRDSQLILMNFFNKICKGQGQQLSPLEFDLYYTIQHVIGIDPKKYEYCLMVDADTEVDPISMNELVGAMVVDKRRVGVCGETQVANKWASWVTWIQVHEYYINHHLGKTFESMFGSVTCLPGCFSMYRVWYMDGELALVADKIIEDYKINKVHTLHSKNLLHLGEDRYLTTLLLKHCPDKRLEFIPSALCKTDIPDSFEVLLSQRRRWINSTFHNLYEVMRLPRLCAVCFISMKFLVLMDLMSTMILPASTIYLYILIVRAIINGVEQYTMVLIGAAGLYVTHLIIILVVKRQYEYVLWITVYIILSMPVFAIILPTYAFWHFDDFSWGTTRQVEGAKDGGHHGDAGETEVKNITQLTIPEWEREDPRMRNPPPPAERYVYVITQAFAKNDPDFILPVPAPKQKDLKQAPELTIEPRNVIATSIWSPQSGEPMSSTSPSAPLINSTANVPVTASQPLYYPPQTGAPMPMMNVVYQMPNGMPMMMAPQPMQIPYGQQPMQMMYSQQPMPMQQFAPYPQQQQQQQPPPQRSSLPPMPMQTNPSAINYPSAPISVTTGTAPPPPLLPSTAPNNTADQKAIDEAIPDIKFDFSDLMS